MFEWSSGKALLGELSLRGRKSYLRLHNDESFVYAPPPNGFIKGVLHDHKKVSLLDCVLSGGQLLASGATGAEHATATFFPNFVVYGDRHIAPSDESVLAVNFVIDDAATLFYDFHAFGTLIDASPFIDQIVQGHKDEVSKTYPSFAHRAIPTGTRAQIAYFTGKTEIFSADTVLGKVSAWHAPGYACALGNAEDAAPNNISGLNYNFAAPEFGVGRLCPAVGRSVKVVANALLARQFLEQFAGATPRFGGVFHGAGRSDRRRRVSTDAGGTCTPAVLPDRRQPRLEGASAARPAAICCSNF